MRIALEDISIFEGPRLTLVAVHHQILGLGAVLWNEGPFSPRGKPRPAQTAEVSFQHRIGDLRRRHGRQRFPGCDITTIRHVRVPPCPLGVLQPGREDRAIRRNKWLRLSTRAVWWLKCIAEDRI